MPLESGNDSQSKEAVTSKAHTLNVVNNVSMSQQ